MRLRYLITLVAFACGWSMSAAKAADKLATFSSLAKDDELLVRFTTAGCFHFESYELKFRTAGTSTVFVTHFQLEWARDGQTIAATNHVQLGQLALSKSDLSGLDRLLEFYRETRK